MKKVSRKDLILLAVILIGVSVFVIPRFVFQSGGGGVMNEAKKGRQVYYCPMHPTYVSDRPGDCPICNMKLVPKSDSVSKKEHKILFYRNPMGQPDTSPVPKKDSMGMDYVPVYEDEGVGKASRVPGHAVVEIPPAKQQLMGVKVGVVEKRPIVKEIRTVGRVAYDAELFSAQQEFISTAASLKKAELGPYHEPLERTKALVEATKTRLRLLGMSEKEIVELEKGASRDRNLILPNTSGGPMSTPGQFVWVYGTIYEYELPFVKAGMNVKVRVPTLPDQEFSGEIRALDPVLDEATRSIRVRARVENPAGLLRPGMYVDLYLRSDEGEAVAVPEEAVMFTGERALVFVARGEGFFEPREVTLGTHAEKFYEVKNGLEAGERVAVSGNFLIDSESRLQGAFQGMTEGGHPHGQ